MTQILQKRAPALNLRAGHLARQLIEKEGLQASFVDIIPGAAGGPKGIGIQGLDQAIFGDFLAQALQRRTLVGSSIGSWRFASILAWGAKKELNVFQNFIPTCIFIKNVPSRCRQYLQSHVD